MEPCFPALALALSPKTRLLLALVNQLSLVGTAASPPLFRSGLHLSRSSPTSPMTSRNGTLDAKLSYTVIGTVATF